MKISNKAYALLWAGQAIGAEIPASTPELRAWVSLCAYIKGKYGYGPEGDVPYRIIGNTSIAIYKFEVRRSTLDADYDVVGELLNERRITVAGDGGIDELLDDAERILEIWGVDPSLLGPLDDEYPL